MSTSKKFNPYEQLKPNQLALHTSKFGGVNVLVTLKATDTGEIDVVVQTDRDDLTKKQLEEISEAVEEHINRIVGDEDGD